MPIQRTGDGVTRGVVAKAVVLVKGSAIPPAMEISETRVIVKAPIL
jgi:hypothetical protein